MGLLVDLDLDSIRDLVFHGVGVPQTQAQSAPRYQGPIADADDVQLLGEPLRDPADVVGQQRPRQPVERAMPLRVFDSLEADHLSLETRRDAARKRGSQLGFPAADENTSLLDSHGNSLRDLHRQPSDS